MAGDSEKRTLWWNQEVKETIRAKKDAFKAWLQDRSSSDLQSRYTEARKAATSAVFLPYFLKISGYIIALPLFLILNCCITAGIFPSKLKLAKVVPVYKIEPTDQLTNYRPISLLPSSSKVFERIICNRLLSFFTCVNTIVPTQYGFRHNRSTIHVMLDLITTCYDKLRCV